LNFILWYWPLFTNIYTILIFIITTIDENCLFWYTSPTTTTDEWIVLRSLDNWPFSGIYTKCLYSLLTCFYYVAIHCYWNVCASIFTSWLVLYFTTSNIYFLNKLFSFNYIIAIFRTITTQNIYVISILT
jgi:hypothetical protein